MSSENAIFESTRNALKKAQEYSVQLDPKTNPDVQSDEFIGTTSEELVRLRNELNSALLNTNPIEQKRLVEGIQERAMTIRNRLAEISLSDAFQRHIEANKRLVSNIENIHSAIKVINTEQIPTIIQQLDPQKNGGITSATFGEKLKPALTLYEEAKKSYAELLTSQEKPAEQFIKLQTIQQQFIAARTAFQEVALTHYESDILAVSDKRFSDSIASKLKAETPLDNAEILAAMPGENDKEKAWNYRLLAAYSDSFTTPKVPRLQPKPSTTEAQSRFDKLWNFTASWFKYGQDQIYPDATSMMDSLKKASGQHNIIVTTIPTYNRNGPWIPDKTDAFKQKGSFQPQISRASLTETVLSIASNPTDEGAKHLADVAESLNNLKELAPVYLSLAKEHYFILLAQKDASVQPPAIMEGRESLPTEGLKKEYDVFRTSRGSKSAKFEWKGVDSKGWDFSPFKDDTYEFADIDDEKIFLESSMKLLPVFDNIDEKYLEAALGDWPIFDHAKSLTNIVANGATDKVRGILKWAIGEGGTAALGVLASLRSPNAFLLGQLLDKLGVRENEGFDDLPLLLMIFRIIRQTRVLAMAISLVRPVSSRLVKIVPYVGPLLHVLVEKKIAGGDTYSNVSDVWWSMFRSSAERVVVLDKKKGISVQGKDGLERLKSDEPSYKQYTTLLNIIDQRIAAGEGGTVEVPVYDPNGHPTENVTLDGVSPEFGRILKELVADSVCEAYLAEAVQQKGKTEQEKLGFRDGKNGDKIVTFVPDKSFWLKMVEDAFASPHPWEQVRTGNAPDISRLNNGFSRNFGFIRTEDQIDGTGTFRHVLRRWGAGTLGNVSNAYTYRLPSIPGIPDNIPYWRGRSFPVGSFVSDSQQAFHNRMSVDGLLFGRGYADAALSYVKQLAKHLPETLKVELINGDVIHHDVEALEKYGYKLKETDRNDTAHFDEPNEKKLLKNCHFEGQFPKNGWKVAVATMLIMTRGTNGDILNDHVPALLDDGHHHFDLKKCADVYNQLSETGRKAVNALFDQALPPNHGPTSKVDPGKIMEVGKFLGVLPDIPGRDGIQDNGKARPLITALESTYFRSEDLKEGNSAQDASKTEVMEKSYEEVFVKHAKEYGKDYDSKKHIAKIKLQREVLCEMERHLLPKAGTELYATENEMKHHIQSFLESSKGKFDMDIGEMSAHDPLKTIYTDMMKKLTDAIEKKLNQTENKSKEFKKIYDDIENGVIKKSDDYENRVTSMLTGLLKDQQIVVATKIVTDLTGHTPNPPIANEEQAANAILKCCEDKLNAKIVPLRAAIDISSSPNQKDLLAHIKRYREYPDSTSAGKTDVQNAYSYIEEKLEQLKTQPAEYYRLFEHLKKGGNNPENGAVADTALTNKYQRIIDDGETQCKKFQDEEILPQLTTLTSEPDFRKLQSKFAAEKQNIQNKYGVSLCTFGGVNQLEEAQKRFDAKEAIYVSAEIAKLKSTHEFPTYAAFDDPTNGALFRVNNLEREFPKYSSEFTTEKTRIQNVRSGHTAVQQLCAQIQSGSVALDDVNTQFDRLMNGYPAYKDMYLLEANTSIDQAKKAVIRATSTPNTPPLALEARPQNPSENPTELLKNEMTELELTEAYKNYKTDSSTGNFDILMMEMAESKYSNLRACYRCGDRILGSGGLRKYGPAQILSMLKASTVDADGTVVLSLPSGDIINEVELKNTFAGMNTSPAEMMMRMDMSGMGRSRAELHTTGIIDKRFELRIHR